MMSLVLSLLIVVQAPGAKPQSAESYLADGIKQVEDGDLDTALVTLDTAVRRLALNAGHEHELAKAHIYLALAYLGLAQKDRARAAVQLAWQYDPRLELDRAKFPPTLIEMYAEAIGAGSAPDATPPATSDAAQSRPAKKGGSRLPLLLVGAAAVSGGVALAAGAGGDGGSGSNPAPTPTPSPSDGRRTTNVTGTPAQLLPGGPLASDACSGKQLLGALSSKIAVAGSGPVDIVANFSAPAQYRMVLCTYVGDLQALRLTGGTIGCDPGRIPTFECVCAGTGPSVSASTSVDGSTELQLFFGFSCDGPIPSSTLNVPWSATVRHP